MEKLKQQRQMLAIEFEKDKQARASATAFCGARQICPASIHPGLV